MTRPTQFPTRQFRLIATKAAFGLDATGRARTQEIRAHLVLMDSSGEGLPVMPNRRAWRSTSIQSILKLDRELNAALARAGA